MKKIFALFLCAALLAAFPASANAEAAAFTFEKIPGKHGCDIFAHREDAAEWLETGLYMEDWAWGYTILYWLLWPGAKAARGIGRLISGQAHSCVLCTLRVGDMPPNPLEKEGWVLTCNDEFDGPQLNEDIWHPCYMHEGKPGGPVDAAHSFRDGSLVLRIDRDSEMWRDSDGLYVSGIHTNGKFAQQYGYFEIRAKSQTGGGIHTAFWTMNAEGTPYEEIDIFEQLGRSPATNHHALHLDAGKGDGSLDSTGKEARMGFDTTGGFHIYALEWDESSVKYYADNMLVHQIDKAPQHNAYIILSMYMSEDPTYWTAPYNPDVPFPKEFVIDYFRAYKKA